ncbi:hypothetical protein BDY19DRAFT_905570 [Irpex rosettiformis]|uniref:Uncharacterized protein n=1 Tax=Irpex rosettiformis TaxID=378272 RepID=A0ACB8U634_9APHY|nr:hypothetical protein BDY19DRAFT_905570 [Irpex rosettiformis]
MSPSRQPSPHGQSLGQLQQAEARRRISPSSQYSPPYTPLYAPQNTLAIGQPNGNFMAAQHAFMHQQHPGQPGIAAPYNTQLQSSLFFGSQGFQAGAGVPPFLPSYPQHGHHTVYPPVAQPLAMYAPLPEKQEPRPVRAIQSQKARPNYEPAPGVFSFQVVVLTGDRKREFTARTDMEWDDLRDRINAYLDCPANLQLVYKVTGDSGQWIMMASDADFRIAMDRLSARASSARTRPVCLEVKNNTPRPKEKGKGVQKRKREDDIPPTPEVDTPSQLKSFRQLEAATRCDKHDGHCYLERNMSGETHRSLDHSEMTLWAKKISLGQATVYAPPHCLRFDRLPTKKQPEVHLTINAAPGLSVTANNVPEASSFEMVPLAPSDVSPQAGPSHHHDMTASLLLQPPERDIPGAITYPSTSRLLFHLDRDFPGWDFPKLKGYLDELQLDDAAKLLAISDDVMECIGNMGPERVTHLKKYAVYGCAIGLGLSQPLKPLNSISTAAFIRSSTPPPPIAAWRPDNDTLETNMGDTNEVPLSQVTEPPTQAPIVDATKELATDNLASDSGDHSDECWSSDEYTESDKLDEN